MVDFGKRARTGDTSPEKLVCAAIHWDDGEVHKHQPKNIEIGWVVCGHRHHNCFSILFALGRNTSEDGPLVQGFLTDLGNFVDRREGARLSFASEQTDKDVEILFSEDLY